MYPNAEGKSIRGMRWSMLPHQSEHKEKQECTQGIDREIVKGCNAIGNEHLVKFIRHSVENGTKE
jgi:hypothetical protein